jgi:pimeloyl-ACP methyl ester carboxylesterase
MLSECQIDLGDVTINYVETGDGPPLFLLHGLTQSWRLWSEEIGLLSHRWHVFAPDARGHGGSSRSPAALYNYGTWVSDTARLIEAVGTEPVVVVGFSMGGTIATGLAGIHHQLLRAAVLVEPGHLTAEQWNAEDMREWKAHIAARGEIVRQNRDRRSLEAAHRDMLPNRDAALLRRISYDSLMLDPEVFPPFADDSAWSGVDLETAMRSIDCPALVMQGNPDLGAVVSDQRADQMKNAIADCTHIKFDDAGHGIPSDQPVRFRQALFRFLDTI